ncbi:MAG: relaxase domain-containing protein, partial [Acetobacteraceae bacterium]|nr:relaxase domain-containing protein [Acetobacteraceae bacterium]
TRGLYGHSTAEPRRGTHPRLAALLGLDPRRVPSADEIGHILSGRRADGSEIEGRSRQGGTVSLVEALGLDPMRLPSQDEIAHMLEGRRADGTAISGPGTATAQQRFLNLMGVSAEPDGEQVAQLLAGRSADGSERDASAYRSGVEASKARIAAVDLTFSADKSLSVAWALAPTEAERNILAQAHKDAVTSTMAVIAEELGQARRGRAGAGGTEPGHITWIGFDHYASRPVVLVARTDEQGHPYTQQMSFGAAGDPALHSHILVPSVVLTDTGRVGALDLDIMAGKTHSWGAFYQAFLATNLKYSGVAVALDERTGAARLTAIPESVREAFSKRTRGGTEAAREFAANQGKDWDSLSERQKVGLVHASTRARRQGKDVAGAAEEDRVADFGAWERQARTVGYAHKSVLGAVPRPAMTREHRLEGGYQAAVKLLDRVFVGTAKVDAEKLRETAARGLIATAIESVADVQAITRAFATRGVQQEGREVALIWGEDPAIRGKSRIGVTTTLHEAQESEVVARLRQAAADRSAALSKPALEAAVRRSGLSFEGEHGAAQRAAIDVLGSSGRFAAFVGAAGAGKSAILHPLVDAWRAEGRRVFGTALGNNQTEALDEAGIRAADRAALDPFLRRAAAGNFAVDRDSVVVVEEVGRVGTRQLRELTRLQGEFGFKLVAIGDPEQLQSIEAGHVVGLMRRALGENAIPEIATTLRQRTEEEKLTTGLFREGRTAEAIERKRMDGTAVLVVGDDKAVEERIAALWRERVDAGAQVTVSAPTNADARAVALAIREQRRAMGQIGADLAAIDATSRSRYNPGVGEDYEMRLGVGDRVRLYERATATFAAAEGSGRSTHGNIGNNGSVLEVRAITPDGMTLRNAAGREGFVRWATLRDGERGRIRLGWGDALTIDAVQGSTVGRHILAMPSGSGGVNGYQGYTASSRHRDETLLVVGDAAERREIAARRPRGDFRPIGEGDVWANVARNLARKPERSSALAFLERAVNVRRGTVRTFQGELERLERRQVEGKAPTAAAKTRAQANVASETVRRHRASVVDAARPFRSARARMTEAARRFQPALERARDTARALREMVGLISRASRERVAGRRR